MKETFIEDKVTQPVTNDSLVDEEPKVSIDEPQLNDLPKPITFSDLTDDTETVATPGKRFVNDVFEPSRKDLFGAVFRTETDLGSVVNNLERMSNQREDTERFEGVEFYDKLTELEKQDPTFVAAAATSSGPNDLESIREQYGQEQRDKQLMAEFPISTLGVGILEAPASLSTFITGGGFAAINKAGSALKTAAKIGALNAFGVGVDEAILHKTQVSRTAEETLFSEAAAFSLGALLGGYGQHMVNKGKMVDEVSLTLQEDNVVAKGAMTAKPDTVTGLYSKADMEEFEKTGAGIINENTLDSAAGIENSASVEPGALGKAVGADVAVTDGFAESIAGAGGKVAKYSHRLNPIVALNNSRFTTSKKAAQQIFEQFIAREKNKFDNGGIANKESLATNLHRTEAHFSGALMDYRGIWLESIGITPKTMFAKARAAVKQVSGLPDGALKWDEFDTKVGEALIRGDVSDNPSVQKAAEHLRKTVYEPLKDLAIKQGRLPKNVDVSTATSYFMREFNKAEIKLNQQGWRERIKPWFVQKNNELKSMMPEIEARQAQIKKVKAEIGEAKQKKAATKDPSKAKDIDNKILLSEQELERLEADLKEFIPRDLLDSKGNVRHILDDEGIEASIDQVTTNILEDNASRLISKAMNRYGESQTPKPMNERVWLIPDEITFPFQMRSAAQNAQNYVNRMVPALEIGKMAEKMGLPGKFAKKVEELDVRKIEIEDDLAKRKPGSKKYNELESELADINTKLEEYAEPGNMDDIQEHMIEELKEERDRLKAKASRDEKKKIDEQFSHDVLKIVQGMQGVLGRYQTSQAANNLIHYSNIAKQINNGRLMGGLVPASLADIGQIMGRFGFAETTRRMLVPGIVRESLHKNQALINDLAYGLNKHSSRLMRNITDIKDTGVEPGPVSRAANFLSESVFTLSGMNRWQDFVQNIAADLSISRTLRAVDHMAQGKKLSKAEITRLNALGLGKEHWQNLHKHWKTYGGKTKNGSYYIDYGSIPIADKLDSDTYRAFTGSIRNEVSSTIIEPGAGDLPLMVQHPLAGVLFQYKKFFMATHNRALISHMSLDDKNTYTGVAMMHALGVGSYVLSSVARDGGATLDLSPENLALEAMDRSGFWGLISEGTNFGLKNLGLGTATRYKSRSITSSLVGPSVGLVDDVLGIARKFIALGINPDESFTTNDAKKILRLLPYQNLTYLQYLDRKVTKDIALSLGAEESP